MTRGIRQNDQIKSSDVYDDNLPLANAESAANTIEDDLNFIRSKIKDMTGQAHWYSPGDGEEVLSVTSGEAITAGQVMYHNAGRFYVASNDNTAMLNTPCNYFAMAMTSGPANSEIEVRHMGLYVGYPMPLNPGAVYYLGVNGAITGICPDGIILIIGQAVTTNSLSIEFGTLIG